MNCPCHSQKPYETCCAPYHKGELAPPTPTALMRSRYSAYALGKSDYIIATTHSKHPDQKRSRKEWEAQIQAFSKSSHFTDLQILEETESTVTFRAFLGAKGSFTEKSTFEKENGLWRYKEGIIL